MTLRFIGCPAPYVEAVEQRLRDREFPQALAEMESVVVLICCANEERWVELGDEVGRGHTVVGVLPSPVLEDYIRALAAGAYGVVPLDTSSVITATVVEAASHGEALLPRQAAQDMATLARRSKPSRQLDEAESQLLLAIASGATVVDLARRQFYSERTVRRHLQSLYLKIGVRNRAEAIAAAGRMGLLD